MMRVSALAKSVYGTRESALEWLRQPNPRLGNRRPMELLKTPSGARIVQEQLIQIDEGIFV